MSTQKILVLGANGQVGRALCEILGEQAIGLSRAEADLSQPQSLSAVLEKYAPRAVINAAAYTQVDKAETERELATKINGEAPGIVAQWCAAHEIPFVHYSTDYVFAGDDESAWREDDAVAPLNFYGASKLAGEQNIQNASGKFLIFRTMLKLGAERETLKIVNDQHGAPTYAPHLAQATIVALQNALSSTQFPRGVYHLCGGDETTWHGFAVAIFEAARAHSITLKVQNIEAVSSSEFPTPAKRPHNSRLNCEKAKIVLGVELPHWRDGLNECFRVKTQ
jgi:dTDP-4-dehydrorhamnose reductase